MAGGLPGTRKFEINPKCLIISGALAGLYWVLPPKSTTVVLGTLIGGYVAIAYYDEIYNCEQRLSADTILHEPFGWLKPAVDPVARTYGTMR
jgi:hypothetical protein